MEYEITEIQIERAMGENKDRLMGIDFDGDGFQIWLKEPYIFLNCESGVACFDYCNWQSARDVLKAVSEESETICLEADFLDGSVFK